MERAALALWALVAAAAVWPSGAAAGGPAGEQGKRVEAWLGTQPPARTWLSERGCGEHHALWAGKGVALPSCFL